MKATIKYELDDTGRKALLIAGGDGKANQTITIDIEPADIDLMSLAGDGSLSADATTGGHPSYETSCEWWSQHAFSAVPDAATLLAFLRDRTTQRVAAVVALEARKKAKAEADAKATELARAKAILALRQALADGTGTIIGRSTYGDKWMVDDTSLAPTDPECGPDVRRMMDLAANSAAAKTGHEDRLKQIKAAAGMPASYPVAPLPDGTYQFECPTSSGESAWAKHLQSVDSAGKNGYAFEGPWLRGGSAEILAAGELVICGSKYWSGSRARGEWNYNKELYIVTPAGLVKLADDDDCKATAIKKMNQEPAERVEKSLKRRKTVAREKLDALAALDRTTYAAELADIDSRTAAWQAVADACAKALEAPAAADELITDIDSAAAAIVAAGYKALAKIHHPDAGMTGSDATMALLNTARAQLRDMLKLAGVK